LYFPKILRALSLPARARGAGAPDVEFAVAGAGPRVAQSVLATPMQGELTAADARTVDGSALDAWALALRAGQGVVITVRGARSRTDPAVPLDVVASLRDGDTEVARDDDSAGGLGARIAYTAPRDGSYTLLVTSFGPALREGRYRVTVRPDGARDPSRGTGAGVSRGARAGLDRATDQARIRRDHAGPHRARGRSASPNVAATAPTLALP
jgi:hypothetical protein